MRINTKNRTLLLIILIFIINSIIFGYLVYKNSKDELDDKKRDNFKKIETSFTKSIDIFYVNFFTKSAEVVLKDSTIEAIKNRDRDKLHSLVLPHYEMLQETKSLLQMHFHLEDGTTLLRMHNRELYGDDVSSFRPMARAVKENRSLTYGFEEGLSGISYRVMVPIFEKERYLGALEFGSDPSSLLDIVTLANKISGVIRYKNTTRGGGIQYQNIKDSLYLEMLKKFDNRSISSELWIEDRLLTLYSFDLLNYSGEKIGEFIFFDDLSAFHIKFNKTLIGFLLIAIVSWFFTIWIINFGFNVIISKLQDSYEKIKRYARLVDEYVIISSTDLEGNITEVSDAFVKKSGYSREELLGKNHRIVRHPENPAELYDDLWSAITRNKTWSGELKTLTKSGESYWVKSTISPIFDSGRRKIGYTSIREDITDKKQVEELSIRDGLTGIYNRRYFNEITPKIINRAKRDKYLLSLMILDIDHFKEYNDNYGHQEGDRVLVAFANMLKSSLKRADDYAFRLGGEEFGILFRSDDAKGAKGFAEKIKQNLKNLNIPHEYSGVSECLTSSIGVVTKEAKDIISIDLIYKEADDLLYKAKNSGRDRIYFNI